MPDFRFRLPSINDLTDAQKIAYYERRPILVTGGPGSGKTVVSIFRYLRQIGDDQNAVFFTFNRTLMSAIRGTIRQRADILLPDLTLEDVEEILSSNIGSIFEWYGAKFHAMLSQESDDSIRDSLTTFIQNVRNNKRYSELVFDESQDLRPGIIRSASIMADRVTCGADRSQDLQGHYRGPADDIIYDILKDQNYTIRQELTQNFRNTKEIFEFARKFVPEDENVQGLDINELPNGENPNLRGGLNADEQLNTIFKIIQQYPNNNIGILVHTKNQIVQIKEFLEKNQYSCSAGAQPNRSFSYYYNNMDRQHRSTMENHLKTPFILTYDSCKGLEFDIVIMPFFEKANWALNNYKPTNDNPEYDANGNPKYWATPNHYYVGATRARSQLFVLFDMTPNILNFWSEREDGDFFNNPIVDLPF